MNILSTVESYLRDHRCLFNGYQAAAADTFEATVARANIPLEQMVKALLLKSGKVYLMAIVRGDQQVDIQKLNRLFQREFTPCTAQEIAKVMPHCDPRALPALPGLFKLHAIQDKSIAAMEQVYFATGVAGRFIAVDTKEYGRLQENVWRRYPIAISGTLAEGGESARDNMRRAVRQVKKLPPMPGIVTEIIQLKNNPYSHASELAAVIEQDPSLSAQLIRYATSPLYGYQGKVESVEQAIVRVLGMDMVQDIAFGLALGKSFKNPKEGPLGLNAFWQHALCCASLTQALCNAIDYSRRPPAGLGYLAGLLHNVGILLLGHLFPHEFERLNRAVAANPQRSLLALERETLRVSHIELGKWLMEAWEMPREITETVIQHHNPQHRGDFSIYANLVFIANALLKRHGLGDAESVQIPAEMLQRVGLEAEQLEAALESVLQDQEGLAFMASEMAA